MNYSQEVVVNASTQNAFEALAKTVDKWWGKIDKPVNKVGDEFTITFGETFWKFRVLKFEDNKNLSYECYDANHVHEGVTGIETEWIGTTLNWNLEEVEGNTKISFLHEGLVQDLSCYNICEGAWDFFILDSLKNYLETGKGSPHII